MPDENIEQPTVESAEQPTSPFSVPPPLPPLPPSQVSVPKTVGYDIPSTEGLTPDEAASQINRIMADISGDKNHPYSNRNHPQNKEFNTAMQGLFAVKNEGAVSPIVAAMTEGLEEKAEKQSQLVERAKAESAFLDGYEDDGFDAKDIPDDISEWQVSLLTEKRLIHQEEYGSLLYMFEQDVRNLKIPADVVEPFRQLTTIDGLDPKIAENAALNFLDIVKEAALKKYGRNRQ